MRSIYYKLERIENENESVGYMKDGSLEDFRFVLVMVSSGMSDTICRGH